MNTKRKFSILHMYQKMGQYGFGPGLTCTKCGYRVSVRVENDEPILKCYICKTTKQPGLDYISMLEQTLLAMDIQIPEY